MALSNERILGLEQGLVRFRWKDYADGNTIKVMQLATAEFIRRFLLHVVPDGFVRIRHFGILANRTRKDKLDRCRGLLGQPLPATPVAPESVRAMMLRLCGVDIDLCPLCHRGHMRVTEVLQPVHLAPVKAKAWDSS